MEEPPVGYFAGPTIQVVLQYLISVSMKEIKRVGEFKKEKLKSTFIMIQNILDDAEMHQVGKRAVKLWLKKLEYVSFGADNVLDEFYKYLRKTKSTKKKKLEPFFSGSNFRDHRLKLIRKIRDINLLFSSSNFRDHRRKLIRKIRDINMGFGITLTRKVFRHEKTKAYCGTWVRISKTLDLCNKILTALTSENVEVGNKFCNLLLLDKNFGYMGNLEVNSSNKKGLTPLDVLVCEGGDCEIEEMLTLAAGGAITGAMSPQNSVVATQSHNQSAAQEQRGDRPKSAYNKLLDYFKFDRSKDSLSEVRNALLVTAVLIATVTYQAVLTPPGGVWQDDSWPIAKNNTSSNHSSSTKKQPPPHTAGKAVMATHTPKSYGLCLIFNSLGLFASLQMMSLLILGFPLQFELTAACFAIGVTYAACVAAITPTDMLLLVFLLPITMLILSKVVRDCEKGRGSAFPKHKGKC